jgi:hypothetical protein
MSNTIQGISMKPSHPDSGTRLKALVAATPVLGAAARSLSRIRVVKELRGWRHRFRGSSSYWEQRYRQGGTSGAGSFRRLAEFKAETLNDFVARVSNRSSNLVVATARSSPAQDTRGNLGISALRATPRKGSILAAGCRRISVASISSSRSMSSTTWSRTKCLTPICARSSPMPAGSL